MSIKWCIQRNSKQRSPKLPSVPSQNMNYHDKDVKRFWSKEKLPAVNSATVVSRFLKLPDYSKQFFFVLFARKSGEMYPQVLKPADFRANFRSCWVENWSGFSKYEREACQKSVRRDLEKELLKTRTSARLNLRCLERRALHQLIFIMAPLQIPLCLFVFFFLKERGGLWEENNSALPKRLIMKVLGASCRLTVVFFVLLFMFSRAKCLVEGRIRRFSPVMRR